MQVPDATAAEQIKTILDFWFEQRPHMSHFKADKALDGEIRERFGALMELAASGGLAPWRSTPDGSLAEIVLLDQFSRNAYRGNARSFAQDPLACTLTLEAIARGDDEGVSEDRRPYFYLPLVHSEVLAHHDQAMPLLEKLGNAQHLKWGRMLRGKIERFGRYPHRNGVLKRESTAEEIAFLTKPKP